MAFRFDSLRALIFTPGWHARRDARHASTLGTVQIPLYIQYQPAATDSLQPQAALPADQEESHHDQRTAI